ncbi:hypothetical protein GCM10009780_68160 [Actinomadura alba]
MVGGYERLRGRDRYEPLLTTRPVSLVHPGWWPAEIRLPSSTRDRVDDRKSVLAGLPPRAYGMNLWDAEIQSRLLTCAGRVLARSLICRFIQE